MIRMDESKYCSIFCTEDEGEGGIAEDSLAGGGVEWAGEENRVYRVATKADAFFFVTTGACRVVPGIRAEFV